MTARLVLPLLLGWFMPTQTAAQTLYQDSTYAVFGFINDNAFNLTKLLNTGNDIGETHNSIIGVQLHAAKPKLNFTLGYTSTQYTKFNDATAAEPRDLFFTEVNRWALGTNTFTDLAGQTYYAAQIGVIAIQGNKLGWGAAGQQHFFHNTLLKARYPNRYWIYLPSDNRHVLPFIELKYGYNYHLPLGKRVTAKTKAQIELNLAANKHFSAAGLRCYTAVGYTLNGKRLKSIDYEAFAAYATNLQTNTLASVAFGPAVTFRHLRYSLLVSKPLRKNLENPYIVFNDLEWLIHYGFMYRF